MPNSETEFLKNNIDILCCPKCGHDLVFEENRFTCGDCSQNFEFNSDIPSLYCPNDWDQSKQDVTTDMKSFYEENPFPDYDNFDSIASLIDKSRDGVFSKLLDDGIPPSARVIECGCGTGQLTNFLSIANRTAVGTDMCLNSLKLARGFKDDHGLKNAHFFQMNLFKPCFKPESFDLVISNGVLHHTSDPFLGFKTISSLVKPNGYILIGLYHTYGRLITDFRRIIFSALNDKFKFLDPRLINQDIAVKKRHAWFMDQYKNPHESKHTQNEAAQWLDETGFKFIKSIPKTVPFEYVDSSEQLFSEERMGNWFERALTNFGMIFTGSKEGGFFTVIGKKIDKSHLNNTSSRN